MMSEFVKKYIEFRRLLHYDLPNEPYYPEYPFGLYLRDALKVIIFFNLSLFTWSVAYYFFREEVYIISACILIATLLLKVNKSWILIGLLGLLPILYNDVIATIPK